MARELGLDPQGKRLAQIVAEIDAHDAAQNKPAAASEKLKLNIFGLPDGMDFLPGTQAVPASSLKAGDWIVIDSAINSVKGVKPISSQRLELDLLGADGRYAIEVNPSTTMQRKLTSADSGAAAPSALDGMLEGLDAIKSGMAKKAPPALELSAPTPAGIEAQQARQERAAKADAAAKRADAAAAQADDDRKRIAAASVAAADSFELGQDPMDSLTGQKDVFADAPQQQTATEAVADKPPAKRKLPPKLAAKAAEVEAQRAAYFAPGNVVASYAGHDRVVAYTPADAQGNWSVTVQPVEQQGDKWVDVPSSKPRTHSTQPDARVMKAGPVVAAKPNQAATPVQKAQAATNSGADAQGDGVMFSRAGGGNTEAAAQFKETERAYGGREAYDRAKAAGKTKLNYGQWVQVRTPNFKAWFGDWEDDPENASKVVDSATGEPMVVYHGGTAGNVFSTDYAGSGGGREKAFFFTPDIRQAKDYAGTGSVKEVFLNLKRRRKRGQWHRATGVRDVSSAKLVKTKMAKSTLDAGWSMLRAMLEYKSHQAGIVFEVVNESYTTETCSCCGTIPASSPKSRLLTIKPVQVLFF